jgi:hypothetical protein
MSDIVFSGDIISLITKKRVSKFIKKSLVKTCKACKGAGYFRGVNVYCSKCARIGYTGSRLDVGSVYKCKINKKCACFYARIKVLGISVVESQDIIKNGSYLEYGFDSGDSFGKFLGKKYVNGKLWSIDFELVDVVSNDDITKMQIDDNRKSLKERLSWT